MAQKVDRIRLTELSAGLKRMGREISGSSTNMQQAAGQTAARTRERYTEGYVQSAAYGVENLLKQIRLLAGTLSGDLDRKAAALTWAADQYQREEKQSAIRLERISVKKQSAPGISRNKGSAAASKTAALVLPDGIKALASKLSYNPDVYSKEVELLQKRLTELGYPLEADGYFGKQTKQAVNAFKKTYGLGNTGKDAGIVGEMTWLYLFGVIQGGLKYSPHEYCEQVRIMQIRLRELGYEVTVNGRFDAKTKQAVNAFKSDHALGNKGDVAGVVGPHTWKKLFSELKQADSSAGTGSNTLTETKLTDLAMGVIFGNEGHYGTVVPDDGGGLSVGKIQWHGERARDLILLTFKKMNITPSQGDYATKLKKHLPASLANDLIKYAKQDKWWYTRVLTLKEKEALAALLTAKAGKEAQDEQAQRDVQVYLDSGRKLGITDPQALVYYADLKNQSPRGANRVVEAVRKAGLPLTLKNIHHAALKDEVMGKYSTRRNNTYKESAALQVPTGNPQLPPKPKPEAPDAKGGVNGGGTGNPPGIDKFLAAAEKELAKGFKEHVPKGKKSGDNNTPYGKWYGLNYQPWCAMFVSYVANEAGILGSVVPKYASVEAGRQWYIKQGRYSKRSSGYTPKAGDVIFFTRSGQNHTGIVTGYDSKSKTVFTIEGNTKDRVARRSYKLTDTYIVGYGKNGGVTEGQTDSKAESGKGYSTR